jgi:hypothetical protein
MFVTTANSGAVFIAVMLSTFIEEVLSSNLRWNTPYRGFPYSLKGHARVVPQLGHKFCVPNPVQLIIPPSGYGVVQ